MSSYDEWKSAAPEGDEEIAGDCPVCDGGHGEACSEECANIVFRAARVRMIRGWYETAKMALRLARRYRREDGPGGRREHACIQRVRATRDVIRVTRVLAQPDVDTVLDVALAEDMREAAQ